VKLYDVDGVVADVLLAQVCLAVVYCFLAAGVVFGFAALKPVLISEGVYRKLCSQEELDNDVAVCDGQEIKYGQPKRWT
jgi:hypothetical protein